MADPYQIWLEDPQGTRVRVGADGVVAGRDPRCDLVLSDPSASRQHALFVCASEGPRLLALGQADLQVNGVLARSHKLAHGDRVLLPGLELSVDADAHTPERPHWIVTTPGFRLGVPQRGLRLGDPGDVKPDGWSGTLLLRPEADRLVAVATVAFSRNGTPVDAGAQTRCLPGDTIESLDGRVRITIDVVSAGLPPTRPSLDEAGEVRLEMLPRGGRLHVVFPDTAASLYLPERRFALVSALLQPPEPLQAGDPVPDETLLRLIWPRNPGKSRVDINVLLGRIRNDLEAAGIPKSLITGGSGGGSTKFLVGPRAKVVIAT